MAGLAERYLTYLAEDRRFSPNTIATYRRTFATFPDMETASREQVESWWAGRVDKAVTTRRNELSAIRSFYRW